MLQKNMENNNLMPMFFFSNLSCSVVFNTYIHTYIHTYEGVRWRSSRVSDSNAREP